MPEIKENQSNNEQLDIKIGARILSDDQLNKLLPTNGNIHKQIVAIRRTAESYQRVRKQSNETGQYKLEGEREFGRHFDNTFSILGGRGSGKTSVLLTLNYQVRENSENVDVFLPIIVPEKMGHSTDVLGCVLGQLKDVVESIEKQVWQLRGEKETIFRGFPGFFENCRKKSITVLAEKYRELLKQYRFTKKDYRKILLANYVGFNDYITESQYILDADQRLAGKFEEFVEELLDNKRKLNGYKYGIKEQEPLVFLFFDDVDLSTERCEEVLHVILRYFAHSNTVVFIAGDYAAFVEVLTIYALKKDGILDHFATKFHIDSLDRDNINKDALEVRQTLAQDLLKKVIPPALRYNMPLRDERARANFRFSTEKNNKESKDINKGNNKVEYPTLAELIKINFFPKEYSGKVEDCFFEYGGEVIYAYFRIFDSKPRGLMNVYYFLSRINNDQSVEERYQYLKQFLSIVIQSSLVLSKHEADINRIIDIRSIQDSYIDFDYIKNVDASLDDRLVIFILAHFIENLIAAIKGLPKVHHGAKIFSQMLNEKNPSFRLYPQVKNLNLLMNMHTKISENISDNNVKKIGDTKEKEYLLGKYYSMLSDIEFSVGLFQEAFKNDRIWIDKRINDILWFGGDERTVLKREIHDLFADRIINLKIKDSERIELRHEIKKFSEDFNFSTISKQYAKMERLLNIFDDDQYDSNIYDDKLLYFEEKSKNSRYYKITPELIEAYHEIIAEPNISIFTKRVLLRYDNIFDDQRIKVIPESIVKAIRNDISERRMSRSNNILRFVRLLDALDLDPLANSYYVPIDELVPVCLKYIEQMVKIEMDKREIERHNNEVSFYNIFIEFKARLLSQSRSSSFTEYIQRMEEDSRRIDIDVQA